MRARPTNSLQRFFLRSLTLAGCLALSWHTTAAPTVLITNLPAYGTTDTLRGLIVGGNPASQAVAVFIYVPDYGWVSKPTCAQPLTGIQSNGAWSANVVTGGGDTNATRYAALLVSTNYNLPCVAGQPNLPTNVFGQAFAKAVVTRPSAGVRFFNFSGYDWWVKNSTGTVGPGPNYFSDQTNNVWTDTNGWLHLRITHRTNAWQCAEVISARTFGPGNYRFELNSPADGLDTNVTLGLFTWSDDPAFAYREIDVECGRWEDPSDTNNAQFVVQPYNLANHLVRYAVPGGLTNSTQLFVWATNRILFQSQTGSYSAAADSLVASWTFTNSPAIPLSGDEAVHLNLWLVFGNPPANGNEVEVIVKSFNFLSLDLAPPAGVSHATLAAGHFQCQVAVQPDFRYAIQASSNLLQWTSTPTVLATNTIINFEDTNSMGRAQYYRVMTLQ